ncbi:MAG: acyl-CoA synthetase [Acidobacteria bacterium]|nr:acyl-CoA synthetase [Acidobacteriota bacterium]
MFKYHVCKNLGPIAAPSKIKFMRALPKTRSGKIQRNQLRRKQAFDTEKVFVIE